MSIKDLSHTMTVADVYGSGNPTPPDGHEFTGEFRPPVKDETFLGLMNKFCIGLDVPGGVPRLILRKAGPTVESVYGKPHPRIPDGYEATGEFRTPQKGEFFLSNDQKVKESSFTWERNLSRLILRRIPRKRVIFEQTGEHRLPKIGDWIVDKGIPCRAWTNFDTVTWDIYTRREEEF